MDRADKAKLFAEGRDIACVFNRASTGRDTVLRPSQETIDKLARQLDLTPSYVRKCLNVYCWG